MNSKSDKYVMGKEYKLKSISNLGFTRSGYIFKGWSRDGSSALIEDEATLIINNSSTELTANWVEIADIVLAQGYHHSSSNSKYKSDEQNHYSRDLGENFIPDTYSTISAADVGHSSGKFVKINGDSGVSSPIIYSVDNGISWSESKNKLRLQKFVCGGMWNGSSRFVCICGPVSAGSEAGNYVGGWWSDDCVNWTRSHENDTTKFATHYDEISHCGYGRLNGNDVFIYTSTCGPGRLYSSLDGGETFYRRIDETLGDNGGFIHYGCVVHDETMGDQMVCVFAEGINTASGHHLFLECSTDGISWSRVDTGIELTNAFGDTHVLPEQAARRCRMASLNGTTVLVFCGHIYYTKTTNMATASWTKTTRLESNMCVTDLIATGTKFIMTTRSEDGPLGNVFVSNDGIVWTKGQSLNQMVGIAASNAAM